MWGNTKSKTKANKILTSLKTASIRPFVRRTKSGVAKIVRDTYGSKADWFALCKLVRRRDQHRCVRCGTSEDPRDGVYHDVHHIRPLSRGGLTVIANLILLCKLCHEKRHPHMRHK